MTTARILPPLVYERLTPAEGAAVETFLARLHELLRPDQICSVILYGSKARGDEHPFSDVDLLLVVDNLSAEEREQLEDLTLEFFRAPESDLQILIDTYQHVSEGEGYGSFLLQNIERDGIVLEGAPIKVKKIDKPRLVQQELDQAFQNLKEAELLFSNDLWRGAVAKTYYIYEHTARALLAAKGVTPQTHKGTHSLLSLHLIKPKILDEKYLTILRNLEKHRLDADYNYEAVFNRDDAETARARAKEFLAVAQNLLPTLMGETSNR